LFTKKNILAFINQLGDYVAEMSYMNPTSQSGAAQQDDPPFLNHPTYHHHHAQNIQAVGGYPMESCPHYHEMANYYVTDPSHPPPPHEHAQPPYELWSPQQRHPVDMTHSCPDNQPATSPPDKLHLPPSQNFPNSGTFPNFSHYLPPQFAISPHGGVVVQPPQVEGGGGASKQGGGKKAKAKEGKPAKPKGTPGRKVKVPDSELTPMEARKRRMRRERNKIAAAKCRDRRRLLTDQLEGETQLLSNQHQHLKYQQYQLEKEKKHLQHMLDDHVRGSKCRLINSDVIMPEQGDVILHEASAFSSFVAPPPDAPMQLPGFSGATSAFEQRHRADEKSGGENSHVNSMLKLL